MPTSSAASFSARALGLCADGLTINPYLGYAWERIETLRSSSNNNSYLYGLTVDWRWRMINLNVK